MAVLSSDTLLQTACVTNFRACFRPDWMWLLIQSVTFDCKSYIVDDNAHKSPIMFEHFGLQ